MPSNADNHHAHSLFDYAQACALRDIGIAIVSSYPNDAWVQNARRLAVRLAQLNGTVDSDMLQQHFPRPDHIHPNATGGVFRTDQLRMVGTKTSRRMAGHARRIGIYVYVEGA